MKNSITTLILALVVHFPITPQSSAQDAENPKEDPIVGVWRDFMNLPKDKREEYGRKLIKVQNLFNQKRIFDALEQIDELDQIFKDHPAALNIKGACYVEIRAFDKANKVFERVLAISPKNINVRFNLAEVDFVTQKWESALERFKTLIPMLSKENKKGMVRLCEFKLLLCMLKTDRVEEAIALKDKYDAWDDSPFYYYSRAAIYYHQDKKLEAEKALRDARYVWRNDAALAAWQDTLIEFGYIRSFYGGDAELEK